MDTHVSGFFNPHKRMNYAIWKHDLICISYVVILIDKKDELCNMEAWSDLHFH